MMKQLLLFSTMILLLAACSESVELGEPTTPITGPTGDCIWTLTGTKGDYTLTISGNGAMMDYIYSDYAIWNIYRKNIRTLILEEGVTNIGNYAFSECRSLTSVTIPNSVTRIGDLAFYDCLNLTSVIIPNSVTRIGDWAFNGCLGLTSVTISDGVTEIGDLAFAWCSNLTSVTIPGSVTRIEDFAFSGCLRLENVTVEWATPLSAGKSIFKDVPLTGVTLHVPAGTKALYQAADGWKDFETIVETIVETMSKTFE